MADIEYAIVDLMDEQGMSQAELSRRSGVSSSSLSRYLQGDDIPASKLKKLADALGATTDELLGIESDSLSTDEKELVENYRNCIDIGQKSILKFARTAAKEFPAVRGGLKYVYKPGLSEEERHEEILRFYKEAKESGLTDEKIVEMFDQVVDAIVKMNSPDFQGFPKIDPIEHIAKKARESKPEE